MKQIRNLGFLTACILAFAYMAGCKKVDITEGTTSDLNIYSYLKQHPDSFSMFAQIVEKSGYAGFLDAYGSYTIFAPTNRGVQAYLTKVNKTSVDQFTQAEAQNIVKIHLMEDTLVTASFKDGKLPTITMYGQYLITGVANVNGFSSFQINRQALLEQGNIHTGNGYIHIIDNVLEPASKSLAQQIAANPNYSIFYQALQATGYLDTLNTINTTDPTRRWLTVMAETNQALADSGYTTFAQLKSRLSQTGNPMDPADSLHIYVAYHIMPGAKYLADIVTANSHTTIQPLEVVSSKLDGEKVLINDIVFNGFHEIGVELQRATSDISSTNGVLHTSLGHFRPKVREAAPIYWDVADFAEIRKLPLYFRKATKTFAWGEVKDITWDKPANTMDYAYTTSSTVPVYWNDYLRTDMGNTSRNFWWEFVTPMIVKGKYKVWICYRAAKQSGTVGVSGGSNMPCQVYFDDVATSRTFAFTDQRPNLSDGEMEALGWKRYTVNTNQLCSGKFVGVIDVQTTDRHKIRIQALPAAGTGQTTNWLDMIHFIPVNMNQVLPRFDRDGSIVYQ